MYTPPQEPNISCTVCNHYHYQKDNRCPNSKSKQTGFNEPKTSPTHPLTSPQPAKTNRNSPKASTVNTSDFLDSISQPSARSPSSGKKRKKSSSKEKSDDQEGEATQDYALSPTEPTGLDTEANTENHTKTEPSRPAVSLVISNGQNPHYVNESHLLLTSEISTGQIVLHEDEVSTPHAIVRIEKSGRVTVRDLRSTHGTFVDDQPLQIGQVVELKHNRRICFGSSAYDFDLWQRQLRHWPSGRIVQDLSWGNLWLISRDTLHEHILSHVQRSSPHLLIELSNDPKRPLAFKLRDLGTEGGTYINGHDLRQMKNGTFSAEREIQVQIGQARHSYKIEAQWIEKTYQRGQLIGTHYEIEKIFHQTSISELYFVKDNHLPFNRPFMIAKVPYTLRYDSKKAEILNAFRQEAFLMKKMRHENLLPSQESSEMGSHMNGQSRPYLIMRYIQGCNLGHLLSCRWQMREPRGLRLVDVQAIFSKLLSAIEYLHDQGWIHCDLKPENILLGDDGHVWLIDLGAATRIGEYANFRNEGFSAPETNGEIVNQASDIYSLGKILSNLITDQPYAQELQRIHKKATLLNIKMRYANIAALRQALNKAYDRPKSKAARKREGAADLAKLAQKYSN